MGEFTKPVQFHKQATEAVDRWFWSFWSPQVEYFKSILVPQFTLNICGNEGILRNHFNLTHGHFPATKGVGGLYSTLENHDLLWVVSDHRLNQWTLGHELQHLLANQDSGIPNPDNATRKEYYK